MLLNRINSEGYQLLRRDRHIIARQLGLNDSEYRLWDLLVTGSGWDKEKYPDIYETVEATGKEIANILRWSESKVTRTKQILIEKEIIKPLERSFYMVMVIPEKGKTSPDMQYKLSLKQGQIAGMKGNRGYSLHSSLLSSMGSNLREDEEKIQEEAVSKEDEEYFNSLQLEE